jgi:hypothetical protein
MKSDFYSQFLSTCAEVDIPVLSKDLCARLLAIVYVLGGSMEAFTFHPKLRADYRYAQRRMNIGGGLTPDKKDAELLRRYITELETYYESAPRDTSSSSPLAVVHPEWVQKLMSERYGLTRLWI